MSQVEIAEVEALLIDRLKRDGDWRDIEALGGIDTETAEGPILAARQRQITNVQNFAVRLGPVSESDVDTDTALRMVEECKMRVGRKAVLDTVRKDDRAFFCVLPLDCIPAAQ